MVLGPPQRKTGMSLHDVEVCKNLLYSAGGQILGNLMWKGWFGWEEMMYQLFKEGPLPNRGELALPEFRRIRDGLRANVNRVIEYHRANPMAVANGHLLAKLLQSLNVPITLDPSIYNDKVRDVALNVAKSLKMTTALMDGNAFSPGVFYGPNVTEVIWAHMDDYDTSLLIGRWRELEPVQVLCHPKTDLTIEVPDGKDYSDEAGMAVIAVNVPMLASQYRMWWAEQRALNSESPRSIMQFLMEVPLPRMLPSHLDIAVTNRLLARYFGVDVSMAKPNHKFAMTDWNRDVDQTLDRVLYYIPGRAMSFDQILSAIPTVFAADLHERIKLPDMAFVRQVQCAVVVARLTLVMFLVQFNEQTHNNANQQYLNYLQRYLKQLDSMDVFYRILPPKRAQEVEQCLDDGVRPYI